MAWLADNVNIGLLDEGITTTKTAEVNAEEAKYMLMYQYFIIQERIVI
jgi:hypothetical protein